MIDLEKEREAFEAHASKFFKDVNEVFQTKDNQYIYDEIIFMWDCWVHKARTKQSEIDSLKAKLAKYESGEFLMVPRKATNAMAHAGKEIDGRLSAFKCADIYKAMIEAAGDGDEQ